MKSKEYWDGAQEKGDQEGLDRILRTITAEAQTAAEQIVQRGRKRAEVIRNHWKEECLREREAVLAKTERSIVAFRERRLSQAKIEGRNRTLHAKQTALEQVFSIAGKQLEQCSAEEKRALYERLIAAGICGTEQENTKVEVQMNREDRLALGMLLRVDGVRIRLDQQDGHFSGGVVVRETLRETDCTFPALLEQARKTMEAEAASMLFS